MQIKTNDPYPKKMWAIGTPSKCERRKLARRTDDHGTFVKILGVFAIMVSLLMVAVGVAVSAMSLHIGLQVIGVYAAILLVSMAGAWRVFRPKWAVSYLAKQQAAGTVFMLGTPAHRLFVGTSGVQDREVRKSAIDARLLSFHSWAHTVARRNSQFGSDDYWFLRSSCAEEWGWLKNLHVSESTVQDIRGELECVEWEIHNEVTAKLQRELDQCGEKRAEIERRRGEYRASRAPLSR